ncbi:MAG: glycosyltransferase family 2 protein [Helicobacteraceae bacterium]|jgi:glycosyltransferase involved in cell wall biosynthesis|nr:glycosyltransferase family 2 protein [Helicobacteraceae bacterium]
MNDAPLVSIIIPTYKRQNLLQRAVKSALSQTYKNIEVLICDDEKSAATKAIAESIAKNDNRLRYLENVRIKGACGARNTGIYAAQGEIVALFDDDDEILSGAIESFINLDLYGRAFAYAWHNRIYENGKIKLSNNPSDIDYEKLAKAGQNIANSMLCVARGNLVAIGGFDETLSACQDYDLCLRLTKRFGSAVLAPNALFNYYSAKSYERISNSADKKYRGMRKIALKHSREFPKQYRAKYLYKVRKYLYGAHLGRAFAWLPLKEALKELKHFIKHKIKSAV